jgi:tetratricopeptide (TPR) repeat protein
MPVPPQLKKMQDDVLLKPLDALPGPARILSSRKREELISACLERQFGRKRGRLFYWRAAAILLITFGAASGATGLTYMVIRTVKPHWVVSSLEEDESAFQKQPTAKSTLNQLKQGPGHHPPNSGTGAVPSGHSSTEEGRVPKALRARSKNSGEQNVKIFQANDLLARANQRRSTKNWQEAEKLYRFIGQRFPGSDEAYAALVSAASLRLEHLQDPRGALTLFLSAHRAHAKGYLSQEVDFGIAECYRALGNWGAEYQALKKFISVHARGPLYDRAYARLRELQKPPT